MAYVTKLFNHNFIEYASYVIKDRAIPHIHDGLKPVQRRILHSLLEMDDGKFHKVANAVGHCMRYHPHGDQSILSALVVLANKDLFIDKQGNFGNTFTGDEASAARYIECRITPLAKRVLYKPELTEYEDSYDGRNKEPVVFPAKIPVVLVHGAEGIAVGMSTRILPHNFIEVLQAVSAAIKGEAFELYPDFPTGGIVDVSDYNDGLGKILVRAKLDTSDPKRVVIRELPFGSTTESLINSIENAARRGKIKIAGISDYTTEEVEIEIKLARGVYTREVVDALYAFTDCETSISVNPLVITDGAPAVMPISKIIEHHSARLIALLRAELELEQKQLRDRLHARTLEQIFVEERIYKDIEQKRTQNSVTQAVVDGFKPFAAQIKRKVTIEDVERLLRIPIRRISLYDINKAKKEMQEIRARLKEIRYHLSHIEDYAVGFLGDLAKDYKAQYPRLTKIKSFSRVDIREAAKRNLSLKYDEKTGYLGTAISGGRSLFAVSPYDRILVLRASGMYSVIDVPEKLFVDKGMLSCGLADKEILPERVFSIIYRDKKTSYPYLKRCRIEQYILGKSYSIVPDNAEILRVTTQENVLAEVTYEKKPQIRILKESFDVDNFLVKGVRASGTRMAPREARSGRFVRKTGDKEPVKVVKDSDGEKVVEPKSGPSQGGSAKGGTSKGGTSKGGTSKGGTSKGGTRRGSSKKKTASRSSSTSSSSAKSSSSKRKGKGKGQ
jgi:topoisomerase-4 subunit A